MAIKRRKPIQSRYVTIEPNGNLSVRTPPDCVRWPTEFLLRLSKFWIRPNTLMRSDLFQSSYIDNGWSSKIYTINKRHLRIFYLVTPLRRPIGMIRINATVVQDNDNYHGIELTHPEFVFRNLQVYEFVTGQEIGGVPRPKQLVVNKE